MTVYPLEPGFPPRVWFGRFTWTRPSHSLSGSPPLLLLLLPVLVAAVR